jgi:hypothetical protein
VLEVFHVLDMLTPCGDSDSFTFTVILFLPQVGFVKPMKQDFAVLFIGFRKWNPQMRKFLDEVDDTIEKLHNEGGSRTVLSLFPINMLCGEL